MKSGYIGSDGSVESVHGAGNLDHKQRTPLAAIKYYCLNCMGGSLHAWRLADGTLDGPRLPYDEVRSCSVTTCELWPFRQGRNPHTTRKGASADTLRKARQAVGQQATNGENGDAAITEGRGGCVVSADRL